MKKDGQEFHHEFLSVSFFIKKQLLALRLFCLSPFLFFTPAASCN